jgi:hypothetical protein
MQFVMPEIRVGTVVLFYVGADRNQVPQAAMVTGVGHRNLVLSVFAPNTYNLLIRDGVRHMHDPDLLHNVDTREMGGWDYTHEHRMLIELQEKVKYLMAQDVPMDPEKRSPTDEEPEKKRGPGRPRKEETAA